MKELPTYLESKIVRVPFSTCWFWVGAMGSSGYGHVKVPRKQKMTGAHRATYEAIVAPIPEGFDIDHLCRVRCCVNPAHLEPVTRLENLIRAGSIEKFNRAAAARGQQTNCKNGHPLSGENMSLNDKGGRICIICRRARDRQKRIDKATA